MSDDKEIRSYKANQRDLRRQFEKWTTKARSEGKPICISCARIDASNGRLGEYKDYTTGFKEIAKNKAMLKEYSNKDQNAVEYLLIDYKCPNGHGFSAQYSMEEYKRITNRGNKKLATNIGDK